MKTLIDKSFLSMKTIGKGKNKKVVSTKQVLRFEVEILEYKTSFGKKCLIQPVNGEGKAWVSADSLKIVK